MKNFKLNTNLIILGISIITLLVGMFLISWPRIVRSYCSQISKTQLDSRKINIPIYEQFLKDKKDGIKTISDKEIDTHYQLCLTKHGVTAEPLFQVW